MPDWNSIISKWPSAAALADDLGISVVTVRAWRVRGIPARRWPEIVRAAKARRLRSITFKALSALAVR
jgi:hypothetical protein